MTENSWKGFYSLSPPTSRQAEVVKIEAILLVWGARDEVLKKIPVEGYWLYGEYDFIAKVECSDEEQMKSFLRELKHVIHGGTFKLIPVQLSAVKDGGEIRVLEDVTTKTLAP